MPDLTLNDFARLAANQIAMAKMYKGMEIAAHTAQALMSVGYQIAYDYKDVTYSRVTAMIHAHVEKINHKVIALGEDYDGSAAAFYLEPDETINDETFIDRFEDALIAMEFNGVSFEEMDEALGKLGDELFGPEAES